MRELQVVLPVHNEARTIDGTLTEWHEALKDIDHEFVVCEDGSRDDTVSVLRAAAAHLPLVLITDTRRKGYTRAVVDALATTTSPYILCIDSDGQYDPVDLPNFWKRRTEFDIVKGWRTTRADPFSRRAQSGLFGLYFRLLFPVSSPDPSAVPVLFSRSALERVFPYLGHIDPGIWWEVAALAHRFGLRVLDVPIHHRPRPDGQTRVFGWRHVPGIVVSSAVGLFRLWLETRGAARTPIRAERSHRES